MEKVATGKHNGSLHDGLLGMLELRTCRAWMDPYLQGPLELSHVTWIATANSLEGIPPPLRDRFRLFWRLNASLRPSPDVFPNLIVHHNWMLVRPAVQRTIEAEAGIGYELPV